MNDPGRKTILWVIATFALAMFPQAVSMPVPVLLATLLPLAWRIGSEFNKWKPLPALLRHGATVIGLATLFMSYGDL